MQIGNPQRRRFDQILDRVIAELPDQYRDLLDDVPLIVEDEPPEHILRSMKLDPRRTELCGLHMGVPLTLRSVEMPPYLPDRMMLFRGPISRIAGRGGEDLETQIRITLLHEMGHHFGLDEEDLRKLGYA